MEIATFENIQQFYIEYHDVTNLQPLVGEISWTKHVIILNRCKDNKTIIKKLESYFG